MNRLKIASEYSENFLEVDRPSPLSDNEIEHTIQEILSGKLNKDITDTVYDNFKLEATNWIFNSKFNNLTGIEHFNRVDIINGCTQFIDNLYMQGSVQTLTGDYRYHQRLNLGLTTNVGLLIPYTPLIIAMPFPSTGDVHVEMDKILSEALSKNIPIHIDGAWISCCKDIKFDFNHPAIHSVGISLSKGLGLGWNRIGLRWTKTLKSDSISIMNDFKMNNRALAMIGLHFVRKFPSDYLWVKHKERYYKICKDFNLKSTNSVYLALRNESPVGLSPLIRFLENEVC